MASGESSLEIQIYNNLFHGLVGSADQRCLAADLLENQQCITDPYLVTGVQHLLGDANLVDVGAVA
jgi:hypothetical protein